MDTLPESAAGDRDAPPSGASARIAWLVAGAALALLAAVAFGAYRQPELLLNILGLRYCG